MFKKPAYILTVQKTLPLLGESIGISTNLKDGATSEDMYAEIEKMATALNKRMDVGQKRFLEMQKREEMRQKVASKIGVKTND